jgi:hypothetical protein
VPAHSFVRWHHGPPPWPGGISRCRSFPVISTRVRDRSWRTARSPCRPLLRLSAVYLGSGRVAHALTWLAGNPTQFAALFHCLLDGADGKVRNECGRRGDASQEQDPGARPASARRAPPPERTTGRSYSVEKPGLRSGQVRSPGGGCGPIVQRIPEADAIIRVNSSHARATKGTPAPRAVALFGRAGERSSRVRPNGKRQRSPLGTGPALFLRSPWQAG